MDEEDAGYYYEVCLPLENDPDLKNAGVQLVARVELEGDGESRNRLGFERRDKRSFGECIHTAVYAATPEELAEFSPEDYESLVASTEGRPALLPPWEHFASLKSFAAGLMDRGILAILFPPSGDTDNKDFDAQGLGKSGINDQLIGVLYDVAPKIVESRVMQHVGEIIERAPED